MLDASFVLRDTRPIQLSAPADNAIVSQNPNFAWAARTGVLVYKLELSANADFSTILFAKSVTRTSYTLLTTDLPGQIQLIGSDYYWRIRAEGFTSSTSLARKIQVLEDGLVYVDISNSNSTQIGNRKNPVKSIQSGIDNANTARVGNAAAAMQVLVARGNYSESIVLKPGISIFGGYESAAWTRNIVSNTTILTPITSVAIIGLADITTAHTNSTVIEGFTIYGGATTSISNYAIQLTESSPKFLRNTILSNVSTTANSIAIDIIFGSPQFEYNLIYAGNASNQNGIAIRAVNPAMLYANGNYVESAGNSSRIAMTVNGGILLLTNNVLTTSSSGGVNTASALMVSNSGTFTISNNTISTRIPGGTTASGIRTTGTSLNAAIITNNIIYTTAGPTTRYCVYENTTTGSPASFQNNLLTDCGTALYLDGDSTPRFLDTDLNTVGSTTTSGPASGNIGPSTVASASAINFTSTSDWHLTALTPSQVLTFGKNTNSQTCGLTSASSCGGITTDRDGNPRTINYSIGAYERD